MRDGGVLLFLDTHHSPLLDTHRSRHSWCPVPGHPSFFCPVPGHPSFLRSHLNPTPDQRQHEQPGGQSDDDVQCRTKLSQPAERLPIPETDWAANTPCPCQLLDTRILDRSSAGALGTQQPEHFRARGAMEADRHPPRRGRQNQNIPMHAIYAS